MSLMDFVWDPDKRAKNLRKHGIDFEDARVVFEGAILAFEDQRQSYGEQRLVGLGALRNLIVAIAFTEATDDVIRILSIRKATRHERRLYFQHLAN